MANVEARRRKQQQAVKVAKKAAMFNAGEESRYHKRKAARNNGKPMATRETMPWWFTEFSRVLSAVRPEHSYGWVR